MLDVHLPSVSIGDVVFAFAPYEMFDTNGVQIKGGQNGGYSVDSCWFLPGSGELFAGFKWLYG